MRAFEKEGVDMLNELSCWVALSSLHLKVEQDTPILKVLKVIQLFWFKKHAHKSGNIGGSGPLLCMARVLVPL